MIALVSLSSYLGRYYSFEFAHNSDLMQVEL